MEGTRRYWGEVVLVVALAALAVLLVEPLLFIGAAGIGGWLVAHQYAFVRTVSAVADELSITQSPEREEVIVGNELEVSLTVELPRSTSVTLDVEVQTPVSIDAPESNRRVSVPIGERTATTTFEVQCPLAGEFEFDRPVVTAIDETGRFRTQFPEGTNERVVVDPRGPRNFHVGAGGETTDAPFSKRKSHERGPSIDMQEIRAYDPSDPIHRIDWNATARLDQIHVRESETGMKPRMALFLDCRQSMATSSDAGTKFDYIRRVALSLIRHARKRGDPITVFFVGEEGLLAKQPFTSTTDEYKVTERRLRKFDVPNARNPNELLGAMRSLPDVYRQAHHLQGDDSVFADRLTQFFENADPYVERIPNSPLYGVVRYHLRRDRSTATTVLLTDDTNPMETRKVIKTARKRSHHTLAFLTPTALFESDTRVDRETVYQQYLTFERFRRELDGLDRVSAFEVGPGNRVKAVVEAIRSRQRTSEGT